MGWKKFFVGEKVPDKDDPKYKERYERDKAAGEKFARVSGLAWCAERIQRWATENRHAFLIIVFGFVIMLFILNVFRLCSAYHSQNTRKVTAVERVDSVMKDRGVKSHTINEMNYE